jgi:hypothetical protein
VDFPAGNYEIVKTSSPRVVIVRNETNVNRSFLMILPVGESLESGTASLPLAPKSPAMAKFALKGGGQK